MNKKILDFAKPVGKDAANLAIEAYKKKHGENFKNDWEIPMYYASGYTSAHLSLAFNKEWITPLKQRIFAAVIGLCFSISLMIVAFTYLWSLTNFNTFSKFFFAFVPSIAALMFTLSKTYKTWAEAKKTLIEAKNIEDKANNETKLM